MENRLLYATMIVLLVCLVIFAMTHTLDQMQWTCTQSEPTNKGLPREERCVQYTRYSVIKKEQPND